MSQNPRTNYQHNLYGTGPAHNASARPKRRRPAVLAVLVAFLVLFFLYFHFFDSHLPSVFAANRSQSAKEFAKAGISAEKADTAHPPVSLETTRFVYYYQTDEKWKDYLCAGRDPMSKYGCGPTAMAMVVTNLSSQTVTPPEMAEWASQNGYYSPGYGSMHSLVQAAASHFGLRTERFSVRTPEAMRTCLKNGKILVLLMGPGHFTDGGHFILVIRANADGTVQIADPADPSHSGMRWDPALLLSELSSSTDSGAPAWVISQ